MKTNLLLVVLFALLLISCNKDDTARITSEEIGWDATQNVRVRKVAFNLPLGSFFWSMDSTYVAEYEYNDFGAVTRVKVSSGTYDSSFTKNLELNYFQDGQKIVFQNVMPSCEDMNLYGFEFFSTELFTDGSKALRLSGKFNECTFGFPSPSSPISTNASFSYSSIGLLATINSSVNLIAGVKVGTEIGKVAYDAKNRLISYEKVSNSPLAIEQLDRLALNVEYSAGDDIPDGLRRLVNQSILGLNSFGLEESVFSIKHSVQANNGFSDWVAVFAAPQLQSIPAQTEGMISSKRISGRKVISVSDDAPSFEDVDFRISYPYTHDPIAKTLEIAGLKIWYEVVE
jgi:hypothetical protein